MKPVFSFILLTLLCLSHKLAAQNTVRIQGKIVSNAGRQSLWHCLVKSVASGVISVSDTGGRYSFSVSSKDTLVFSCAGYTDRVIPVSLPDSLSEVVLSPKIKELREVDISTREFTTQERHHFEQEQEAFSNIKKASAKVEFVAFPLPGIAVHPLSFFYYRFSHEARAMRRLNRQYGLMQEDLLSERRLSPEKLAWITGDESLNRRLFIHYMDLPKEAMTDWCDQDLYSEVLICYKEFRATNNP